ncbi:MAG: NHLP bacteriocin export ABC transporter permease/ATPase subunit [Chlamydiales bacterium]|nr:NHLP bacteriocin export ABC transporter permease/ATPase subunit [Chlamydiales bacterium]
MKNNKTISVQLSKISTLEGDVQEVPSNHRRFLAYPDAIWMIESGEGAIFAMERTGTLVKNGVLDKGPLTYLSSVKPGSLIFGFTITPEDPTAILIMTHSKAKWKKMRADSLSSACQDDFEIRKEFSLQVDFWINQFASQVAYLELEENDLVIKSDDTLDVDTGKIIAPFKSVDPKKKEDILWVEVLEGECNLFGFDSLKIDKEAGVYPLNHISWISTAATHVVLRGMTTEEAVAHPKFWTGFRLFQEHSLKLVTLSIQRKQEDDLKRVNEREVLDASVVDQSLKNMASVLQEKPDPQVTPGRDGLLRACQLVGIEMGIEFAPVKDKRPLDPIYTQLLKLCQKARSQMRRVTLKDDFWNFDSLPLLAFYKDGMRPVALINKNPSYYEIIDPITLERTPLNQETASKLSSEAYTFYQPFPEGALSGFSIFKFCAFGRRREMLTIACTGVLGGIISLFPPFLNKVLFSDVIGAGEANLLWQVVVGLVLVAFSMTIFTLARSLTMLRLTQMVGFKMETALWDRILSLPTTFFRQFTVGNLIQRVYSITQIHQLISGTAVKILLSGIFSLFYLIAMLYYSPLLALVGLAIIVSSVIVSGICIVLKTILQRKILAVSGILNGIVVQIISGVGKLRISGAENRAFAYWSKYFTENRRLRAHSYSIQNVVTTMTAFLPILSSMVLFTVVMNMLEDSEQGQALMTLSVGSLIAFLAAYVPFSQAIFDVCNTLINLVQVIPLWERSKVILQADPEVNAEKIKPGRLMGDVVLDHISFRYGKESPLVLDNLSLYANPGEFIAIVGPSGCGKSTLVRILLGFEVPEFGSIYYNSKDLSSLDLRDVRHQIGVVLQNGAIFSGSLYENIVCGGTYTKEQVEYAMKVSGFDKDIESFPMGLHTVVQSGGGAFSGGQAQRLLIARALISNPRLLIFDEATSALDNKTQDLVTENLDKLKVTRIVIAHRLSTIKNADRIYVIEKGRVIQEGSFQELSSEEGLFKTMLKRQAL